MPTAPRTCPILHFEKQLADTSVTVRTAALNKLFENRDMRLKSSSHTATIGTSPNTFPLRCERRSYQNRDIAYPLQRIQARDPRTNNQAWDYDWYSDQDIVPMRWGEVLLMKAEAALESGTTPKLWVTSTTSVLRVA